MKKKNQIEISLPFIMLNTDSKTTIDCNISSDRKEYSIQFDNTFQISSDLDVLKRLGFTNGLDASDGTERSVNDQMADVDVERLSSMVPKLFQPYIKQLANGNKIEPICSDKMDSNLPN